MSKSIHPEVLKLANEILDQYIRSEPVGFYVKYDDIDKLLKENHIHLSQHEILEILLPKLCGDNKKREFKYNFCGGVHDKGPQQYIEIEFGSSDCRQRG